MIEEVYKRIGIYAGDNDSVSHINNLGTTDKTIKC